MARLKLSCNLGILTRPDGSALFTEGETSVIAGLYGPVEIKPHKALTDRASVEAHFRPKSGLPGVKDRVHESIVKNICEAAIAVSLYPRACVVVVVQELQNSGQLISAAVNAACLAALNSGIDMRFMFGAVTCFLDDQGKFSLVRGVEGEGAAWFVFVFDSVKGEILASHTEGSFSEEQYKRALVLCRKESNNLFQFFRESLQIH